MRLVGPMMSELCDGYVQRKAGKQWWHGWHCTALHCTALHCTALHCTAHLEQLGAQLLKVREPLRDCPAAAGGRAAQSEGGIGRG